MAKTANGNLTLKEPKLIVIDHHMGHLVVHKIDDIIQSILNNLENESKPILTIRPSSSGHGKSIKRGLVSAN